MGEGDAYVGLQGREGFLQLRRQLPGVADEGLGLRLPELGGSGPGEAAPEALGAGHAHPGTGDLDHHLAAFEDVGTGAGEDGGDLVGLVAVVVVVAQHRYHRYGQLLQFAGKGTGLGRGAQPGQVSRQQEKVGVGVGPGQPEAPNAILAHVGPRYSGSGSSRGVVRRRTWRRARLSR